MKAILNESQKIELLEYLVSYLLHERGLSQKDMEASSLEELWRNFRALVNTRQPRIAQGQFYLAQDKLLSSLIAEAGIVDASKLAVCNLNPSISHWTGDITRLKADAIVNAANSQMLGCWLPGHHCIDNAIHSFAGVQLREECTRIMEAQGHEEASG